MAALACYQHCRSLECVPAKNMTELSAATMEQGVDGDTAHSHRVGNLALGKAVAHLQHQRLASPARQGVYSPSYPC